MNALSYRRRSPRAALASGQAMIEYLVVTALVSMVMFYPSAMTGNMSPASYLARAVRSFFRAYSFLVSVS